MSEAPATRLKIALAQANPIVGDLDGNIAKLRAMRTLADAGVPVGVMVAPVIPMITDHELEHILEAAKDHGARSAGYTPKFGCEYEFFLFQETRDSLEDKGYRGLVPLDPGMFGYSWVRTGQSGIGHPTRSPTLRSQAPAASTTTGASMRPFEVTTPATARSSTRIPVTSAWSSATPPRSTSARMNARGRVPGSSR